MSGDREGFGTGPTRSPERKKRQRKVLYFKYLNVTDGNCLGSERPAARGECEYLVQNQDWVVTGRDCEQ